MFEIRRTKIRRFPVDFAKGKSRSFEILRASIEECVKKGLYRKDDPLEIALTLWSLVEGLIKLYRVGRFEGGEAAFRKLYDSSLRRVLRGIAR